MGSYLSTPVTEKESDDGTSVLGHAYGVSSMQGWRRSQEDAHIIADLGSGTELFGVFDGHGGREVSNFTVSRIAQLIKELPEFQRGDVAAMLPAAFHGIDMLLEDPATLPVLDVLKTNPKSTLAQPAAPSQPPGAAAAAAGGESPSSALAAVGGGGGRVSPDNEEVTRTLTLT